MHEHKSIVSSIRKKEMKAQKKSLKDQPINKNVCAIREQDSVTE